MEDLEQAPPKFEDMQPQVHDPMEEVNLGTVEEPKITYISSLLPSDFKEGIIATLKEFKDFFAWNYNERCQDWTEAWWNIAYYKAEISPFSPTT